MNLKSKTYMRTAEFKAKQLWLAFEDAAGIVLQIMEETKEECAAWLKAWKKIFCTEKKKGEKQIQLALIWRNNKGQFCKA